MKKKFEYKESRGLPGGPNEMFTYVTGVFSTEGYKRNSPDVDKPFNIIPSGNITMRDVDFPVMGTDNLGNTKVMQPGKDYKFPGNMVFETPMAQNGIEVPKRQGARKNPDGTESTHLMATETLDGKNWFSFPTLFQDPDGTWIDMSDKPWKEAYEEAKKRGELIDFGTDKEAAIKFGEGSWKPKMKRGGGLLTKTMKCNGCGWSWKAADGGNDVSTCHKCGGEATPKAQEGAEVKYGTKEYKDLYDQGKITGVDADGNPLIVLPEIELTVDGRTGKNISEDYPFYNKLSSEEKKYFRDSSPIGRAIRSKAKDGVGFNADKATDFAKSWLVDLPLASLQVPQSLMVEGIEALRGNESDILSALTPGEQRLPSDVWGIENDYYTMIPAGLPGSFMPVNLKTVGNTGMDIVADPSNLVGAGLVDDALKLGLKNIPQKAGRALGTEKLFTPKQLPSSGNATKEFGLSIDELGTKGIIKKSKDLEKNVDLGIGKYDHTSLVEYDNGLQLHTYAQPGSKVDDVILVFNPKTNENIAYMRGYKPGDSFPKPGEPWPQVPTNEWHIKADMPTADKDLVKFASQELEKIVQVKPIKYERKTISTDGLRYWNQQQKHGYSAIDDFNKPYVSAAGKDDLFKDLKYSNNDDAFESVMFANKKDATEGAARLENFMKSQGLDYKVIVNNNNTLQINLPKLQRAFSMGGMINPPAAIIEAEVIEQKKQGGVIKDDKTQSLFLAQDGKETSWSDYINPMNWGVTNRDDAGDFKQAFRAARIDGDDEFMWHGERYSTELAPTPEKPKEEKLFYNPSVLKGLSEKQTARRQALLNAANVVAGAQGNDENLRRLLVMSAAMENTLGADPNAYGRDYTRGPMSIDDIAYQDLFAIREGARGYTTQQKKNAAWLNELGIDANNIEQVLRSDDPLAGMAAARLVYGRAPEALPSGDNPDALYNYYLKYYNKGGIDKYGGAEAHRKKFNDFYNQLYRQEGGEQNKFQIYKDYVYGVYDGTEMQKPAEKIYDKLNRVYYKEAKQSGTTVPNYILSKVMNQSG